MFSYSGVMNIRLYEARMTVFVAFRKYATPTRGWSWFSVEEEVVVVEAQAHVHGQVVPPDVVLEVGGDVRAPSSSPRNWKSDPPRVRS